MGDVLHTALKAEEACGTQWTVVYISMWQNGRPGLKWLLFELWRLWVSEFPSLACGEDRLVPLEVKGEKRSLDLVSQKQASPSWGKVGMERRRTVF